MRQNYMLGGLLEADLAGDWLTQFRTWMADAVAAGVTEPNAMVLATANGDGVPAARSVLAKQVDADGVVFYTNYGSAKSADLSENPWAAVTFPWYSLQRQIHVRGPVAGSIGRPPRPTGPPGRTDRRWARGPARSPRWWPTAPHSIALQAAAEDRFPDAGRPAATLGRLAHRAAQRRVLAGTRRPHA